jgi:predicted O-methyltransferase YrrM
MSLFVREVARAREAISSSVIASRVRFAMALREFARDPMRACSDAALMARLERFWRNAHWPASPAFLREAVARAVQGNGPIVECGSGLSTILLALCTKDTRRPVVALEHDAAWAARVRKWLRLVGARHVRVLDAALTDFAEYTWYDFPRDQRPTEIALVICDGPPGTTRGGRSGLLPQLWENLAPTAVILLDDAARAGEEAAMTHWMMRYGLHATLHHSDKPFAILERARA